MSFFISDAMAEAAPAAAAPGGSFMMNILPILAFAAIFYFMVWRPQSKRQKEHQKLLSELSKGDEVLTNGGVLGKVSKVGEEFVSVLVAENVEIKVQKAAIASVLPKGTIKSA